MNNNTTLIYNNLWKEHQEIVRQLCELKLKSRPWMIDDCIQDISLALYDQIRSGEQISNWKAWLLITARNTINNCYYESKKRERYVSADPVQPVNQNSETILQLSYCQDFLDLMITEEDVELAKKEILHTLTETEYELYIEYYLKNQKLKDIAAKHHVSENAMQQRHFRLKHKLLRLIKYTAERMP